MHTLTQTLSSSLIWSRAIFKFRKLIQITTSNMLPFLKGDLTM